MNSLQLRDFIGLAGSTDEYTTFRLRMRSLEKEDKKVEVLWYIYKIAKNTDVFTDDVKYFLFNKEVTYKDVSDKFGVSESNLKNRIFRQTQKFNNFIGADLYNDIIINKKINEFECVYVLDDLKECYKKRKITKNDIEDKFYEDIFTGSEIARDFSHIDDEDFTLARDVVGRFCIPANKFMLGSLEKELKDYIVYLLVTPEERLVQIDRDRKHNIESFFMINE